MSFKNTLDDSLHKIVASLAGLFALGAMAIYGFVPVRADNPTFFFSDSASCASVVTSIDAAIDSHPTLHVCIDAEK